MSASHSHHHNHHDHTEVPQSPRYRKILWIALILNFLMFGVEVASSWWANSSALFADAVDFLGDALNYASGLMVLSMAAVWSTRLALAKSIFMMGFGAAVLLRALMHWKQGIVPEGLTMGLVSLLALGVNFVVAWMFYAFRQGNSNMRAVWLDARNDVLSNLAVIGAALGVLGTQSAWPDLAVAIFIASLAIYSGASIFRHAMHELKAKH